MTHAQTVDQHSKLPSFDAELPRYAQTVQGLRSHIVTSRHLSIQPERSSPLGLISARILMQGDTHAAENAEAIGRCSWTSLTASLNGNTSCTVEDVCSRRSCACCDATMSRRRDVQLGGQNIHHTGNRVGASSQPLCNRNQSVWAFDIFLCEAALERRAEEFNDQALRPWADMCKAAGLTSTPLTPYWDCEVMGNSPLSVDGSAIEVSGFKYKHPLLTKSLLEEQLQYFRSQGLFPLTLPHD